MDFTFGAGPEITTGGGGGGTGAFDTSDYRQNTYGPPTHYCDVTKSFASNGAGTLGDPWNLNQAMANAVAGNVVGFLPIGAAAPADLPGPASVHNAAFRPANSGTAGNPIVFVTKYAASYLVATGGKAGITSNQNRTEIRHAGAAPTIISGSGSTTDTGGPIIGAVSKNYITFDGFFFDMSRAYIREDSGMIRFEYTTGCKLVNFAIKGTTVTAGSNAVIYRPHATLDTTLANFYAWDFMNDGTTSATSQISLFSDQYGDQNVTIKNFDIDNVGYGIFFKGTVPGTPTKFNYGTVKDGIVRNCASPMRFNDLDGSNQTLVEYCLFYNTDSVGPKAVSPDGIVFDSISTAARNITIDHCTLAKVDANDANLQGAIVVEDLGLGSGVVLTNNIIDVDNASSGHMVLLLSQLPTTMNYNFYYRNGATETYVFNGSQHNSFEAWQGAISGRDAQSQEGSSSPFTNRAGDIYTISVGHQAKTMSSTGGEVGCYADPTRTIGVIY